MESQFLGRNKLLDNSQTMVNNTRFILHILKNYLITKYTNIWDNILDMLKDLFLLYTLWTNVTWIL